MWGTLEGRDVATQKENKSPESRSKTKESSDAGATSSGSIPKTTGSQVPLVTQVLEKGRSMFGS